MLLLVGVMVALLALLATLQYRWLGQVSAGERERMQASLSAGAARFSQDFNREISRAYLTFQMDAEMLEQKNEGAFAERLEQWQAQAPFPQIVSDLYVLERDASANLILSRFNRASKKFEPVEWPTEFAALRQRLEKTFLKNENPEGVREIKLDPVEADVPALVSPIVNVPKVVLPARDGAREIRSEDLKGLRDLSPFAGYVIVKLSSDAIVKEMLPALTRRYFSSSDGLEYNLSVINPKEPDKLIFQTSQTPQPRQRTSVDATARLLDVQLDQLDTLFFGLPRRPMSSKERETVFTQKLPSTLR